MGIDEFGRQTEYDHRSWRERHAGKVLLAAGGIVITAALGLFALGGEDDSSGPSLIPTTQLAPETPPLPKTTSTQSASPTESSTQTTQRETTTTLDPEVAKCLADYETEKRAFQRKVAIDAARRAYAEQHNGQQPDNPNFEANVLREACEKQVEFSSGKYTQ